MKLITYRGAAGEAIGVETGRWVIALSAALPDAPAEMNALIEGGPALWKRVRECAQACMAPERAKALRKQGTLLEATSVVRLAPLRPRAILCSGHNYADHRAEKPPVPVENPEFFLKLPQLVIDPGAPILLDGRVTAKLDHETELAVIIGREGRHIPARSARQYVFGYTIMNDVTARDQQIRPSARGGFDYFLGPGKNFDTAAPLGPCIVTADEIPDPQVLKLDSTVNSERRQQASTAQMMWGVDKLIEYFSRFVTLRPGYVISTGTPGQTAWGWDGELGGKRASDPGRPQRLYLEPGDVVRCRIEKIGTLENPVALAPPPRRKKS
jgi:2-keto-4-pentenoate hydratase/2-oxohepta-3-ene-1,7-dioic acid hydratase in catechol pathway